MFAITKVKNWRELEAGQKVRWHYNELGIGGEYDGEVIDVNEERALVISEDMKLWCDDDTAEQFEILEEV